MAMRFSLISALRERIQEAPPIDQAIAEAKKRNSFRRLGILAGPLFAVEVWADLTPGLRLRGLRRLPSNYGAGVLGAEAATWGAISPSLMPHSWWAVAANVAICQGAGHLAGSLTNQTLARIIRSSPAGKNDRAERVAEGANTALHWAMSAATVAAFVQSTRRHAAQVEMVDGQARNKQSNAVIGVALGTLGYGTLLALGEALQAVVDTAAEVFGRRLPPVTSWPLAIIAAGAGVSIFTDRLVIRRFLSRAYKRAEELDRQFLPGADRPHEPERSGSPASEESWDKMGRQGRAVVAGGPRKRDIEEVTGRDAKEPIRIFIGLGRDRDVEDAYEEMVDAALREMDRTHAWARRRIAVMSAAGTGWINDFLTSGFEFVGGGDTAIVAMQYSYLPSAFSYLADRESPVRSSRLLIEAISDRLDEIPEQERPTLYIAGESLGAYGVSDAFDNVEDFLRRVGGGVVTGVPGFARNHRELTAARDEGSPQRLPVVDGGRNIRFCAHPDHLLHDFAGRPYANEWEAPRAVFAQHASDPVVWWDWALAYRAPDWLKEPGSRGVPAPKAQRLDVPATMRWAPFITFWQVGVDQLASQDYVSPHGHNYHDEAVAYWAGVLGIDLDAEELRRISQWIHQDATKLRHAGSKRKRPSY
ncbi:alpha/beta-hydrolase family protein [Corynebacterium liangguodongii]|nr:alpha/beta-hydrolase family protein [Corynebacterium liangguodongii]